MGNTNQIIEMNNNSIVQTIGTFINKTRLEQNKTQARLATDAGINRWTLSQIENGEPITLISLIQILRALDKLDILSSFETKTQVSPIAMAKLEKKQRKRARSQGEDTQTENEW